MRVPQSYGGDYGAIKRKMDADWTANQSIWQMHQAEASIDTRLEAGDATLQTTLGGNAPVNNRSNFYFNRVRPLISQASGYQRNNRKSTVVIPMENGDQKTADQWTKLSMNWFKKNNVYGTLSDAFQQGSCITGMNLIQLYLDFSEDPVFGDIKAENLPYSHFYIDPYFKNLDLSDCRFIWRRSYLSHLAAAMLFPDQFDEILAMSGNPVGMPADNRFPYMGASFTASLQNSLAYDEYYYRDYTDQTMLVDRRTGETMDITTKQERMDVDRFLKDNPTVFVHKQKIPTVRLAIQIQDKVMYDGVNPLGIHEYPFVSVTGYYNPGMPYFYTRLAGLCRSLRDPQMLLNRRIILNMDLAESVANSGFIFKENAIVDVKHLFQTGPGRMIPLKKEAQMSDIAPIPAVQVPESYFRLEEVMGREFSLVSGINDELMGFNADDKSGYSRALMQGAGITTLQPLFDRLDQSQVELGEKWMKIVRANFGPAKIQRMLGGEEPTPLFYNKAFGKYHCQVQLGFNTQSQQQMQFAQLLKLQEVGVPLPAGALLNAATIQDKGKIIEEVEKQQQQQSQMAQQQAQVQQQQLHSQSQWYAAKAQADMGQAAERFSRIPENIALGKERIAEANKDNEMAALAKIKAIKELEQIDLSQLEQLIVLAERIKMQEERLVQSQAPSGDLFKNFSSGPSQSMQGQNNVAF
jgi:hypothetical protein